LVQKIQGKLLSSKIFLRILIKDFLEKEIKKMKIKMSLRKINQKEIGLIQLV
jgi:hypothetical protein